MHDIRQELDKKIEARHVSAPVSQVYAYGSELTYLEHYRARRSSIDTVGNILNKKKKAYPIAYFQGYRQFRNVGLPPSYLPR
ncbi:hypothetical protein BDV29DRAFT_153537 [Aspergillus leporis]|uniref:Uncharacterized protein n=1 Tax=Aspergillus leporis TaxID=41062 RepID=A0A5N5XE75_9EURO|nr:hypothetical protein BDV29DRAFT_153537 [Aspergillus leporis]